MIQKDSYLELRPFLPPLAGAYKVKAHIHQKENQLKLLYIIKGDIKLLNISKEEKSPLRMEGLWESTCFELFLKNKNQKRYLEFNFSPSGHWNCYSFDHYRQGLQEFDQLSRMDIHFKKDDHFAEMKVTLVFKEGPYFSQRYFDQGEMLAGPSVVLEDKDQNKSYWALGHPKKQADFHDPISIAHPIF